MIKLENLVEDLNEAQELIDNAIKFGWKAKADDYLIEMDVISDLIHKYFHCETIYDYDNKTWIAM